MAHSLALNVIPELASPGEVTRQSFGRQRRNRTDTVTRQRQSEYYISTKGRDADIGSRSHPWRTFSHANSAIVVGRTGATIRVAPGIYTETTTACFGQLVSVCLTRGGMSANARVRYVCETKWGCKIRVPANNVASSMVWINGANWIDFVGFDVGGDPVFSASNSAGAIAINNKDRNGNHIRILYNSLHDVAATNTAGVLRGFPAGCPSSGVIIQNSGNTAATTAVDTQIIGNFINNAGVYVPKCNQLHGVYDTGVSSVIEDNVIGNTPGIGIKIYPHVCHQVVSNNMVFHNGNVGIALYDTGDGTCQAKGLTVGNVVVQNNLVIDNGFVSACGAIVEQVGMTGANFYANNLLMGNRRSDIISNNYCAQGSGAPPHNAKNTYTTSDTSIARTFVNYRDDGGGDYHLKAAAFAIGRGTTECAWVAEKGNCTPAMDADLRIRGSNTVDIGPLQPGGTALQWQSFIAADSNGYLSTINNRSPKCSPDRGAGARSRQTPQ